VALGRRSFNKSRELRLKARGAIQGYPQRMQSTSPGKIGPVRFPSSWPIWRRTFSGCMSGWMPSTIQSFVSSSTFSPAPSAAGDMADSENNSSLDYCAKTIRPSRVCGAFVPLLRDARQHLNGLRASNRIDLGALFSPAGACKQSQITVTYRFAEPSDRAAAILPFEHHLTNRTRLPEKLETVGSPGSCSNGRWSSSSALARRP